jgi:hypothetical protein
VPSISITREDLARAFPNQPRLWRAFEELFFASAANTEAVTTGTAATQALADATIITLSTNEALNNERVLAVDPSAFSLTDTGATIVLALIDRVQSTGGFRCVLNLEADTNLDLPSFGRLATTDLGGETYADDAAAAADGVIVGDMYRKTGGTIAWRQT